MQDLDEILWHAALIERQSVPSKILDERHQALLARVRDLLACAEERQRTSIEQIQTLVAGYQRLLAFTTELLHIDPVTGLFSRRQLDRLAERELVRARRYLWDLSILQVELGDFATLQSQVDGTTLNAILTGLGQLCLQSVRDMDMVGYLSPGVFLMVLPETAPSQAIPVAQRVQLGMDKVCSEAGENAPSLGLNVNIGIAGLIASTAGWGGLCRDVRQAVTFAREQGGGRTAMYRAHEGLAVLI